VKSVVHICARWLGKAHQPGAHGHRLSDTGRPGVPETGHSGWDVPGTMVRDSDHGAWGPSLGHVDS
jgi:hypothetical protein